MSDSYNQCWARLPLEGACNVRELGGYPTLSGAMTRYHRFLRSDSLGSLTPADERFLYGYGVRAVIDLRDQTETAFDPDCAIGPDVAYANVPLLELDISNQEEVRRRFVENPPTIEEFYDLILATKHGIKSCFEFIAAQPKDACVLFHCAVGKDRTGTLALLLMALAGCDEWDCVASYMQTRAHLSRTEWYGPQFEAASRRGPANLMDSPFEAAVHLWERVAQAGGIEEFLRGCGVGSETIIAVRQRLIEE